MKAHVNKVTIEIIQRDIWALEVDAVVHQTDTALTLPPALLAKTGSAVVEECRRYRRCEVGSAVVTSAGRLITVQKLIHAVGPRWGEGSERGKLANVTWECLRLTEENRLKSLAMPGISTGALGYPVENCAKTMLTQIIDFTFENLKSLRAVTICLDNAVALEIFQNEFENQLQDLKQSGEGKVRA